MPISSIRMLLELISLDLLIGLIIADTDNTNPKLQMTEPTAFPKAVSGWFFTEARKETENSGKVVKMLTNVAPITNLGTFNLFAIATDESVNQLAPFEIRKRPKQNLKTKSSVNYSFL